MKLIIDNLSKKYNRGGSDFFAVNNLSFELNKGDYVNIIGRSGSGKSTFLNMIVGLLQPSSGTIYLDDELISSKSDEAMSLLRNKNIGFIPQGATTISSLNVIENVVLPYFLHENDLAIYDRAKELLHKLGISKLEHSYPKELSNGEQRRVIVARSLINKPEILIADEPCSDLDIKSSQELMSLLDTVNSEGTSLMIVTHELDTLKHGKTLYTMHEGTLLKGDHLT